MPSIRFPMRQLRRRCLMLSVVCVVVSAAARADLHDTTELQLRAVARVYERVGTSSTTLDIHALNDSVFNPPLGERFAEEADPAHATIEHTNPVRDLAGAARSAYDVEAGRMAGVSSAEATYSGEEGGPFIGAVADTVTTRIFSVQVHRIPLYTGTVPSTFLTQLNTRVSGSMSLTANAGGNSTEGGAFGHMDARIWLQRQLPPNLQPPPMLVFFGERRDRVDIEAGQTIESAFRTGAFAGEPPPTFQLVTGAWYRATARFVTTASVSVRGPGFASSVVDAANSFDLLPYNEPIFLDLPEGITVSAPEMGIVNNRFLLPGDANRDGRVDGEDFLIWQANFGAASGATWDKGDFNGDGRVDGEDFLIWQANFGSTVESAAAVPEPAAALVPEPEPGVVLLVGLGLLAARGRWQRRRYPRMKKQFVRIHVGSSISGREAAVEPDP